MAAVFGLCALAVAGPDVLAQSQPAQQQQQQQFGPRANKTGLPGQGQGQAPKIEEIAKHGAWKVQCESAPPQAEGQQAPPRSCGMVQSAVNEKNPKAEASPETLDKMRKGGSANFIIYEAPGIGMPMKMSLEGFSKALETLDSL
ncbi:MAG: invasion associated locus B family protein [Alphaproteobacteria bacterium]|nr:invasion associated locus B family protein [Alphaproteobacteria bacterium]